MVQDDGRRDTSFLDEWIASEGDEAVAAAVEKARRGIADGSIPGFTDQQKFLEYIQRAHRQSA